MEELIKLVSQKAGIPEAQAKTAVETVMGFIKEKLPAPMAAQLDGLIAANAGQAAGMADNLLKGLGGMLGGNK